jgi:hypothetical protein
VEHVRRALLSLKGAGQGCHSGAILVCSLLPYTLSWVTLFTWYARASLALALEVALSLELLLGALDLFGISSSATANSTCPNLISASSSRPAHLPPLVHFSETDTTNYPSPTLEPLCCPFLYPCLCLLSVLVSRCYLRNRVSGSAAPAGTQTLPLSASSLLTNWHSSCACCLMLTGWLPHAQASWL